MKPCHRVLFALAAALTAADIAAAKDYKPVTCSVRLPYAGSALHAPLDLHFPTSSIPDQPLDPDVAKRLDDAFASTLVASKAAAMTVAVGIPGKGLWQHASVAADAPLFFWASAGKTFTAAVVLQLVEEGKLSLDNSVAQWIKGMPNGEQVTVRDLLTHTSGLFSANEDLRARAKPRYHSPAEDLAIAKEHGAMFCPGANWRYSNTGYDLLGEIIAKVDGRPFEQAIAARLIKPLGLRTTLALVPGAGAPGVAPLVAASGPALDPSWAGAAGPIVSDAADIVRFWAALLEGRIVPATRVQSLFATLYPMFDAGTYYGIGTMVFDVPDKEGRLLWLGHAGGTDGAQAIVAYSPADNAYVAVALTGNAPAAAVANALMKAIKQEAQSPR